LRVFVINKFFSRENASLNTIVTFAQKSSLVPRVKKSNTAVPGGYKPGAMGREDWYFGIAVKGYFPHRVIVIKLLRITPGGSGGPTNRLALSCGIGVAALASRQNSLRFDE
jgi:hypothetical protein